MADAAGGGHRDRALLGFAVNGLVGAELGGANVVEGAQSVQVVNVALTCILGQGARNCKNQ